MSISPAFELQLFGGPVLRREGKRVRLSPQGQRLLGFIAGTGPEGIPRDNLLDLLWEGGETATLRPRLAQALYTLRKRFSPADPIVEKDDRLLLNREIVGSDLETFERALREEDFDVALRLFSQGFLSGLSRRLSDDAAAWVQERETELREGMVGRLRSECKARAESGRIEDAGRLARSVLAFDPTCTEAIRQEGRWLLLEQGSLRALRVVEARFVDAERNNNTWEPSEELLAFKSRLSAFIHGHETIADDIRTKRSTSKQFDVLVGREEEIAWGRAQVRAGLAHLRSLISIAGPSGSGVSAVSRAIGREAAAEGFYLANVELGKDKVGIQRHLATPRDRPLLVIADLGQEANDEQLGLLLSLVKALRRDSATVVVVAHSGETYTSPPAWGMSVSPSSWQCRHLQIDPLSVSSLEKIAKLHRPSLSPVECLALASVSGGRPRELLKLVRAHSTTTRNLVDIGTRNRFAGELACAHLQRYGTEPLLALQVLAAWGRPLPNAWLPYVWSVPPITALALLRRLVDIGVVTTSTANSVCIRSGSLQDCLLRIMTTSDRTDLHNRLARRLLKARGGLEGEETPLRCRIARHLRLAGRHRLAAAVCLRGLQSERDLPDLLESISETEKVLRAPLPGKVRWRLMAASAEAALRLGETSLAKQALLGTPESLSPDQSSGANLLLRTIDLEAEVADPASDRSHILRLCDGLRQKLIEHREWGLLARVWRVEQYASEGDFRPDAQPDHVEEFRSLFLGDSQQLTYEMLPLALVACGMLRIGHHPGAAKLLHVCLEYTREHRLWDIRAEALQIEFFRLYHVGLLNAPRGIQVRQELFSILQQQDDTLAHVRFLINTAVWHIDTFDPETALELLNHAEAVLPGRGPKRIRREILYNRGEAAYLLGDYPAAQEYFDQGAELSPQRPDVGSVLFMAGQGLCLVKRGDRHAARAAAPPLTCIQNRWLGDFSGVLALYAELCTKPSDRESYARRVAPMVSRLGAQSRLWQAKAIARLGGSEVWPTLRSKGLRVERPSFEGVPALLRRIPLDP